MRAQSFASALSVAEDLVVAAPEKSHSIRPEGVIELSGASKAYMELEPITDDSDEDVSLSLVVSEHCSVSVSGSSFSDPKRCSEQPPIRDDGCLWPAASSNIAFLTKCAVVITLQLTMTACGEQYATGVAAEICGLVGDVASWWSTPWL